MIKSALISTDNQIAQKLRKKLPISTKENDEKEIMSNG